MSDVISTKGMLKLLDSIINHIYPHEENYAQQRMATEAIAGDAPNANHNEVTARDLAESLATLFRAHDRGAYDQAVEECKLIDTYQFPHLHADDIEVASRGFIDALREKDRLEFAHLRDGDIDAAGLAEEDYTSVKAQLRTRASTIGADHAYADEKARAWKHHKIGGDYWTPFMWSQVYELQAVLQDPTYPVKPRAGRSGFGPEPVRYILAFELHDMKTEAHWNEGIQVMIPYFAKILAHHESN